MTLDPEVSRLSSPLGSHSHEGENPLIRRRVAFSSAAPLEVPQCESAAAAALSVYIYALPTHSIERQIHASLRLALIGPDIR